MILISQWNNTITTAPLDSVIETSLTRVMQSAIITIRCILFARNHKEGHIDLRYSLNRFEKVIFYGLSHKVNEMRA
jgi:hypothetical protein